jgi:tetratricopeptide (TPR) repeat protein
MGALLGKEAQIHFEAAEKFDHAGDYESARNQYGQALARAKSAGADSATLSMLTYNYARKSGYSCHLDDAEKYLLEALDLEKGVSGAESGTSSMRIFELARLYFDQGNFVESSKYYALGVPIVERIGVPDSDPLGYADALDEYAAALSHIGKVSESAAVAATASATREQHPSAIRHFVATRYRCPK